MQKILKWVFLFLLLGLPICIYFFLQAFGENKFKIPIFYENGFENRSENCNEISVPHIVPDLNDFDSTINFKYTGAIIYNLGQVSEDNRLKKYDNLMTLKEKLTYWQGIEFLSLNKKSLNLLNFMQCGLNLNAYLNNDSLIKNHKLVLVDKQKKIRGYYNVLDQEEIDRLITEVKILLKE